MRDTPKRPVLTIGYDNSEEPYPYVVVPIRYVLDSAASVERLPARLRADAEVADGEVDADEDESAYHLDTSDSFERFYESLPPFPREAHASWMPAWLRDHLEHRVPVLATEGW